VDVPLWVAIQLKRRFNKSRIEAPAWLEIGAVDDRNHLYICRSDALHVYTGSLGSYAIRWTGSLLQSLRREQESKDSFQPMHYHYVEMAAALLQQ